MKLGTAALFLVLSLVASAVVFRQAMWGGSILAPVDTAPALFSKYGYIAPDSKGIPDNHYIIDQLTYDLPLQFTIYDSYRRGEIPWWDPYTFAGRPLLADAHINGTDPIRLLGYAILPFESAYNWNLIVRGIVTGLGMCLLLLHFRFPPAIAITTAIAYQFAGCFASLFGHPWIQGSFAYYPFLWIAWSRAHGPRRPLYTSIAALLVGMIFYAGNLQTHTYVVVFALATLFASLTVDPGCFRRLLPAIAISGILGALIAAPVLANQVEFYFNGSREVDVTWHPLGFLGGIASLGAVFPWAFGTFRTLDICKFFGQGGAAFMLFIGPTAFVLAMRGAFSAPSPDAESGIAKRTALLLLAFYLLNCSTPLIRIFYARIAPLAVMGLAWLAALGLKDLHRHNPRLDAWTVRLIGLVMAGAVAVNAVALLIYPRIAPRVREFVLQRDASNVSMDSAPQLREFQVAHWVREVSLQNPETTLALACLVLLAMVLRSPSRRRSRRWVVALAACNLLPVLLFYGRFVPHRPMEEWKRLLSGGPEQRKVAGLLAPAGLRLLEEAPGIHAMLFPNALSHLHRLHTVHGYSALWPISLFRWPAGCKPPAQDLTADFLYRSDRNGAAGELRALSTNNPARFHWTGGEPRDVVRISESMNELQLGVGPGQAGEVLRTDTFYPGWRLAAENPPGVSMAPQAPCFSVITVPMSDRPMAITLYYRPSFLGVTAPMALLAFVSAVLGAAFFGFRRDAHGSTGRVPEASVGLSPTDS